MILLRGGYYILIDSEEQVIVDKDYYDRWEGLRPAMHCLLRLRVPKKLVESSEAWNQSYFEGDPSEITVRMITFKENPFKTLQGSGQGFRQYIRKLKDRY
jgi:hypothetical protein